MSLTKERLDAINDEIATLVERYRDYSTTELARAFDINLDAKNMMSVLIKKLINEGAPNVSSHMDSEDITIKTIRLDKYGKLKESMSFPVFRYCDIVEETWETSSLRAQFKGKIYVFAVFRMAGKDFYLNKIVLWQMPEGILENGVKPVWQKIKACLESGSIVKYIDDNGRYFSYFPASSESPYVHVRPHAQNREDTLPLPVADKLTGLVSYPKHSFWLNRSYVLKIISREE
jgi:hypothetical protein